MARGSEGSAWLIYGAALLGIGVVAYGAGSLLRLGGSMGHPVLRTYALAGLVVALLGAGSLVDRLQVYRARREVEGALASLGTDYRVYGRVLLRLPHIRPAVADYLVVAPGGRIWPLILDRTPEAAPLARLTAAARRAARTGELVFRAQAEGGLPVAAAGVVETVLVALCRRVEPGRIEGVRIGNAEHLAAVLGAGGQ